MQLYILTEDNTAKPTTWGEFSVWEDNLPHDKKDNLGLIINRTEVGPVLITSFFSPVSLGLHLRKSLNWFTIASGGGFFGSSLYSSSRACGQGHRLWAKKARKNGEPKLVIAETA